MRFAAGEMVTEFGPREPFYFCTYVVQLALLSRFQTSLAMALQALIFMLRDSLIIVSSLMMPVQIVQDFPTWFSYGFLGALRAYSVTSRGTNPWT